MQTPTVFAAATDRDARLVRAVGLGALTANIVNVTVGAGIFVLPALVAAQIGAAAPIAYVVCVVGMALVVLCFAESGSRVSATGGLYAYVEVAFGPFIGFMVGVMLLASFVAGSATVATFLATTLAQLSPAAATPTGRAVALFATYVVFAVANVYGVRTGARVVTTLTIAKIAPLVILIALGIAYIHPANLAWPGLRMASIGPASLVLIFAFIGVESALTPSGEVRDSARTVPRAVILALVIVAVLYIVLQVVAQGVLGGVLAHDTGAPLAALASRVMGAYGRLFVLAAMVISAVGWISGDLLASPRMLYKLASDRTLPSEFARIHPRFSTPYIAIMAYAVVAFLLAVTGTFERLVILASISTLAPYLVCCLATIVLKRRDVRTAGQPFVLPFGPTIPLLACVVIVWLMSSASRSEFDALAGIVVVSASLYAAGMRARARMSFPRPGESHGAATDASRL